MIVRTIIEISEDAHPAQLRMFVHNAPHRRAPREVLKRYRQELWEAWKAGGRTDTISAPIDLSVTFINPTGTDLDNLLVAIFQALDGKTGRGPTILADDRQISFVKAGLLRS
jgi:Holliday junction resolvase RusA-like endonuclease